MTQISEQEFTDLAGLILNNAGIQIDQGKEYLMKSRLDPLLVQYGFESFRQLYQQANSDLTGKIKAEIIDAITINETYFFRDNSPFVLLENKILPDIIDRKSKHRPNGPIPIRIWSAACSTGQEVYSIAIKLHEMLVQRNRYEITILGTDISNEAIARASYGKYNQFEVERGLDSRFLHKYFSQVAGGWRIKDEIRSLVRFSKMDLNLPFTGIGTFDIILCRNVAIYFPVPGKIKLFQKIAKILNPGGALIVGGSESLSGLSSEFTPKHYLNGIFYQLRDDKKALDADRKPIIAQEPPIRASMPIIPESIPDISPRSAVSQINNRLKAGTKEKRTSNTRKTEPSSPETPQAEKANAEITPQKTDLPLADQPDDIEKRSLLAILQEKKRSPNTSLANAQKGRLEKKQSLLDKLKEKEQKKNN
ncbi:protein-glutamate O-methyltransferase CheR [bacterium]|nr:protein-glutamate O-methyltransferase CheR [bacterium]